MGEEGGGGGRRRQDVYKCRAGTDGGCGPHPKGERCGSREVEKGMRGHYVDELGYVLWRWHSLETSHTVDVELPLVELPLGEFPGVLHPRCDEVQRVSSI